MFAVGLGAAADGPPGLTMVGGIAGLTKRSDVRLLAGVTMCPYFGKHLTNKQISDRSPDQQRFRDDRRRSLSDARYQLKKEYASR